MFAPQQSPDHGNGGSDLPVEDTHARARKKATEAMTRSRHKKRVNRKHGPPKPVTGMAHRRQRKLSW